MVGDSARDEGEGKIGAGMFHEEKTAVKRSMKMNLGYGLKRVFPIDLHRKNILKKCRY